MLVRYSRDGCATSVWTWSCWLELIGSFKVRDMRQRGVYPSAYVYNCVACVKARGGIITGKKGRLICEYLGVLALFIINIIEYILFLFSDYHEGTM